MQKVGDLVKKYLAQGKTMQVATLRGDQPWICTVYYVEDARQNLYWLSFPTRRHSQDIALHNKVAVAIQIKTDMPVIGIQAEGFVDIVTDPQTVATVMDKYVQRHKAGSRFYDNFMAGTNKHLLYKFTPRTFVLFDEATFGGNAPKEWRV